MKTLERQWAGINQAVLYQANSREQHHGNQSYLLPKVKTVLGHSQMSSIYSRCEREAEKSSKQLKVSTSNTHICLVADRRDFKLAALGNCMGQPLMAKKTRTLGQPRLGKHGLGNPPFRL